MPTVEWLAGFFDGEGTIDLTIVKKTNCYFRLSIVQVHLPTLQAIQNEFGGAISPKTAPISSKHRQAWVIYWYSAPAHELLIKIRPFLITKRAEADFILDVWFNEITKATGGYGKKLAGSELSLRQELRKEFLTLRGQEYPKEVN